MTPKEKAIELVNKMHIKTDVIFVMSKVQAKQCALIAVDEIMEHAENSYHNKDIVKGAKLYWQEVKQEIEKL